MFAAVLGAAAGGGFPQWNSNAEACRRARNGDPAAKSRTQASLAVSADGSSWFLLNASPDLRRQIELAPFLHPRQGLRSSPIAGVVLTGGDVDAIAGLLTLRERQAFTIYATARVLATLDANPIFEVLARDIVGRQEIPLGRQTALADSSGLSIELFAVPGKVPLYLESSGVLPPIVEGEETVGVAVSDGRRRLGHISKTGPEGAVAAFESLRVERKIFIHINNSNPILLDDSPERAIVEEAGWEVAHDGMTVSL